MTRLPQLPAEILLHIVNEVRSNKDLAAFSRSCRTVYILLTQEMLLRREYRWIRLKSNSDFERGFDLLLAILRRPQLGHLVRHLELDRPPASYCDYRVQNKDLRHLEDGDLEKLRAAIEKAGFAGKSGENILNMVLQPYKFESSYMPASRENLPAVWVAQALAALLISVSPYMESMTTSMAYYKFAGLPGSSFTMGELPQFPLERLLMDTNYNPQEKPWLQYLQSVELNDTFTNWGPRWPHETIDFGMLRYFCKLLSIERVKFDRLYENGFGFTPPSSSNISRIWIEHSNVHTMCLMYLINSCKTLKEFHYSTDHLLKPNRAWTSSFNPRTFLKAILGHKTTLEVLDINTDSDCTYIDMQEIPFDIETIPHEEDERDWDDEEVVGLEELWGRSGSLSDFSSLTHLSIGVSVFFYLARGSQSMDTDDPTKIIPFDQVVLADALPPSLESLCLRGYREGVRLDFDESITRFLAEKDAKLPNLQKVTGIKEFVASVVVDPPYNEELLLESDEEDWTED